MTTELDRAERPRQASGTDVDPAAPKERSAVPRSPKGNEAHRHRILLVEDNVEDQNLLCAALAGHVHSYEILCAGNGPEALRTCGDEEIDCILLDYWLGTERGDALIPQFRALAPYCPVIMLTGQGSEEAAASSFKRGASDYLRKGDLSADAIVTKVAFAIDQARKARIRSEQREELERSNRLDALGELSAGLSHDFNNLLATAQYAISLALKHTPQGTARRHLADALSVLDKGADLTRRLKSFASCGPTEATGRPVGEVLEHFIELVETTLGDQIRVETRADQPDLQVRCDQSQLIQALVNLALNSRDAIVHSGIGSKVSLTVEEGRSELDGAARPFLRFSVSDDGPGMSREVSNRVTDPYFTTKERAPGRGLGLAMVYGFVMQSEGEFAIETEPGKGTHVSLGLPLDEASRSAATMPQADRPCSVEQSRPRILMVDDELLLLTEAAEIVRDFGFDVIEASSAAEALTMIDPDDPIDLLLTDVQMPRMNGFQLARAARERVADLKVLYFSGYTGYSRADMGDVVAPVVTKPCVPEELHRRIAAVLDEDLPEVPDASTIAPLPGSCAPLKQVG